MIALNYQWKVNKWHANMSLYGVGRVLINKLEMDRKDYGKINNSDDDNVQLQFKHVFFFLFGHLFFNIYNLHNNNMIK